MKQRDLLTNTFLKEIMVTILQVGRWGKSWELGSGYSRHKD